MIGPTARAIVARTIQIEENSRLGLYLPTKFRKSIRQGISINKYSWIVTRIALFVSRPCNPAL